MREQGRKDVEDIKAGKYSFTLHGEDYPKPPATRLTEKEREDLAKNPNYWMDSRPTRKQGMFNVQDKINFTRTDLNEKANNRVQKTLQSIESVNKSSAKSDRKFQETLTPDKFLGAIKEGVVQLNTVALNLSQAFGAFEGKSAKLVESLNAFPKKVEHNGNIKLEVIFF